MFQTITKDNLDSEHLCCAIADKKHQLGVAAKKQWLRDRLAEGHVFRKLDEKGKVFIEYAPLETAWVPVAGEGYLYIYCLWVAGSFKGKGYGKQLLDFCLADAVGEYELLALSFDGTMPAFAECVRAQCIPGDELTIYYGLQCPYIPDCVRQVEQFCRENAIPVRLIPVDSLEKAKAVPGIFNNWAMFYKGKFETVHLLNEGYLKKFLGL